MAGYRQLHTRMWASDQWFAELIPEFKLLFIYLFSNERASVCGLYELPVRMMSFETGLDKSVVLAGLAEFEKAGKVRYDAAMSVVCVCNMFKYQGTESPLIKKRVIADIKAVPDCELKKSFISGNRVLIGYVEGSETLLSISSLVNSSLDLVEGGGMGEGTNSEKIPETPREAAEHPEIQLYQQITGRFPGDREYKIIIETFRFLREKHPDMVDYLMPYWTAWSTRKTKDKKPYSPASQVWYCEWAMQGKVPITNGHEPKTGEKSSQNKDIIRKVALNAR